jgi:hypothetical protein
VPSVSRFEEEEVRPTTTPHQKRNPGSASKAVRQQRGHKGARATGRPPGSVKLTGEIRHKVVQFILAGAFDYVAAEAAGISARTFREWVSRGEGRHPPRGPTPHLRAFAKEVRTAKAQARAAREMKVADLDPKHWLRYQARSQPGRDGWTEPIPEDEVVDQGGAVGHSVASAEEAAEVWNILLASGALAPPTRT